MSHTKHRRLSAVRDSCRCRAGHLIVQTRSMHSTWILTGRTQEEVRRICHSLPGPEISARRAVFEIVQKCLSATSAEEIPFAEQKRRGNWTLSISLRYFSVTEQHTFPTRPRWSPSFTELSRTGARWFDRQIMPFPHHFGSLIYVKL